MFGAGTTLVTIATSTVLFFLQTAEFNRHMHEELRGRFVIVERLLAFNSGGEDWGRLNEKLQDFSPPDGSLRFVVASDDPRYIIDREFVAASGLDRCKDGFGSVRVGDIRYSTLSGTIPARGVRPSVRFLVAVDQAPLHHARLALGTGILLASLLSILAMTGLGWWIARRGLRPVDRLSAHAQDLGEGDLALRLPAERLPSELEGLVTSFNGALERLQRSHQQLSDFNADVAHELRTPLTNLIGETEVALARPRAPGDLEAVLQSNLEELDRLRGIINDMLFLSRADTGAMVGNVVLTELAAECERTVAFMAVLFEEAGSEVVVTGSAQAWIERALFGRALSNLLDNALRHGEGGGRVEVSISETATSVAVAVTNPGRAIGAEALPKIFDRFFCEDPARQSVGRHHGLGLAIVKAVARMHGGGVLASNVAGGVVVGFFVPKRPQMPPGDYSEIDST